MTDKGDLTSEQVLTVLRETGGMMEGHFRLTSGRHAGAFIQCSQLFQYPEPTERVARALAARFRTAGIATVIGPAMGGVILSYEVARALGIRAVYTEKTGDGMALRRGFQLRQGERVLVVEDVITTGGSVHAVIETVAASGAVVAGVGVIVDRSAGKVDFGVPTAALVSVEFPSYAPARCPLCEQKLPLVLPKA